MILVPTSSPPDVEPDVIGDRFTLAVASTISNAHRSALMDRPCRGCPTIVDRLSVRTQNSEVNAKH